MVVVVVVVVVCVWGGYFEGRLLGTLGKSRDGGSWPTDEKIDLFFSKP